VEFGRGRIAVLAILVLVNVGAAEAGAIPARATRAPDSTVVVRVQLKERGHRALARELRVRAQDAPAIVRKLNAASAVA
jgi:hypothetical protein